MVIVLTFLYAILLYFNPFLAFLLSLYFLTSVMNFTFTVVNVYKVENLTVILTERENRKCCKKVIYLPGKMIKR